MYVFSFAINQGLNTPLLLALLASRNVNALSLTFDDKRNLALLRSIATLVAPGAMESAAASRVLTSSGITFAQNNNAGRAAAAAAATTTILTPIANVNAAAPLSAAAVNDLISAVSPGASKMALRFAAKLGERWAERTRADVMKLPAPPIPGLPSPAAVLGMFDAVVLGLGGGGGFKWGG